jgi:hypothetical protein
MMKRSFHVIYLALVVLCCTFCSAGFSSAPDAGSKKDYSGDLFSDGSGTKDDPFILGSVEELGYLAHQVRENKYKGAFFALEMRRPLSVLFRGLDRPKYPQSGKVSGNIEDESEKKLLMGYDFESPSRGIGTSDDPYVFDSPEQVIYLCKAVEAGKYQFEKTTYFMLETENWLDYAAESYAGGDGTETNPFLIETAEHLALLAKQVSGGDSCAGKYFKQTKDIDLGGRQWVPIGGTKEYNKADLWSLISSREYGKYFSGIFDGGGRRISRLTMTRHVVGAALFSILENGVVKNVRLEGMKIAMGLHCGGIAVWMDRSKIIDCEVSGNISFIFKSGGIVGDMLNSEIIGCITDIESYYYMSSYALFMENYDAYNLNAINELYIMDLGLSVHTLLRKNYSYSLHHAYVGGIAAVARIARGGTGLIKDCKARVYFSYSDIPHIGYYGGIYGFGIIEIENCEAFDRDNNILTSLGGKHAVYNKGIVEYYVY